MNFEASLCSYSYSPSPRHHTLSALQGDQIHTATEIYGEIPIAVYYFGRLQFFSHGQTLNLVFEDSNTDLEYLAAMFGARSQRKITNLGRLIGHEIFFGTWVRFSTSEPRNLFHLFLPETQF